MPTFADVEGCGTSQAEAAHKALYDAYVALVEELVLATASKRPTAAAVVARVKELEAMVDGAVDTPSYASPMNAPPAAAAAAAAAAAVANALPAKTEAPAEAKEASTPAAHLSTTNESSVET